MIQCPQCGLYYFPATGVHSCSPFNLQKTWQQPYLPYVQPVLPSPQRLDPLHTTKSRYRYIRVLIAGTAKDEQPVEVIAGVEMEPTAIGEAYAHVRRMLERALTPQALAENTDAELAAMTEAVILAQWPDRSYFIEVGRGANREWVQVFAP